MKDEKRTASGQAANANGSLPNRILGSLRDALNAASRDDRSGEITLGDKASPAASGAAPDARKQVGHQGQQAAAGAPRPAEMQVAAPAPQPPGSAAHAVREAKSVTREPKHYEAGEPSTQSLRAAAPAAARPVAATTTGAPAKTQAVRGKPRVVRGAFHQDPVVGWLVVVGGPGLGAFRPIYEGNNGIGRSKHQRIPLDFGDDTISSEEQAYIRYDSMDRSFLFVPNLSKTNIVAVNDKKPTGALKLELMDVITMGRTQLAFVPFCGEEFDWSELADLKE
jgi:hypothetical protein